MPIVLLGLGALVLTFWSRTIFRSALRRVAAGQKRVIAANVASFLFWAGVAGLLHRAELETVNIGAWPPYAAAQLLWLALDLYGQRRLSTART